MKDIINSLMLTISIVVISVVVTRRAHFCIRDIMKESGMEDEYMNAGKADNTLEACNLSYNCTQL